MDILGNTDCNIDPTAKTTTKPKDKTTEQSVSSQTEYTHTSSR